MSLMCFVVHSARQYTVKKYKARANKLIEAKVELKECEQAEKQLKLCCMCEVGCDMLSMGDAKIKDM